MLGAPERARGSVDRVSFPILPLTSDKLINFPGPHFTHLKHGVTEIPASRGDCDHALVITDRLEECPSLSWRPGLRRPPPDKEMGMSVMEPVSPPGT